MRQGTYLNVILTANALLLAGVLWTQVAGHPALAQDAYAQTFMSTGGTGGTPGVGIPNAADQRHKMIEILREVKASVDAASKLMQSGKLKVEVINLDEVKKVEISNLNELRAQGR